MKTKIYIKGLHIPTIEECRKVFSEAYDFIESVDELTAMEEYVEVEVTCSDETPEDVVQSVAVIDYSKLVDALASQRSVMRFNDYIARLRQLIKDNYLFLANDGSFGYIKASKTETDVIYNLMTMLTDTTGIQIDRLNDTEIVIKPLNNG